MFFSVSFSTWKWSSSCASCSWRLRVKSFLRVFSIGPSLTLLQHECNGSGEPLPFAQLLFQLIATGASKRIKLGPAIIVRGAPLGADPAALFQAMERGIKRT